MECQKYLAVAGENKEEKSSDGEIFLGKIKNFFGCERLGYVFSGFSGKVPPTCGSWPIMQELEPVSNAGERQNEISASDNLWQLTSDLGKNSQKWKVECEYYNEALEYIREVEEILNLLRPFPRVEREEHMTKVLNTKSQQNSESTGASYSGLTHLENVVRLVGQLKDIQETNNNRTTFCVRDLRRLKEYKRRLKREELELNDKDCSASCMGSQTECNSDRKMKKSVSDACGNDKCQVRSRRSISLADASTGNKSKMSKWAKVKEAFQWERPSNFSASKPNVVKDPSAVGGCPTRVLQEANFFGVDEVLPLPPPPPLPPPRTTCQFGDFLSAQSPQDLHSSSTSDRLDEFFFLSCPRRNPESRLNKSSSFEDSNSFVRKSSSDDLISSHYAHNLCKEEYSSVRLSKANRTTWSKVKDIIQTRKEGLKKKPKKRSDDEDCQRVLKLSAPLPYLHVHQQEDFPSPEDASANPVESALAKCRNTYSFQDLSPGTAEEKTRKTFSPTLTLTLPSSDELSGSSYENLSGREPDVRNRLNDLTCQAQCSEEKSKCARSEQHQLLSRWIKVKRVFLTSTSPPQASPCTSPTASPTDPGKDTFFSDDESDLSCGEYVEGGIHHPDIFKQPKVHCDTNAMSLIQEDIRRSYDKLQKKLSLEFDQKLREWEIKSDGSPRSEDGRLDDPEMGCRLRRMRDSAAVPPLLPSFEDLSPEFKKKLDDWKKIKRSKCLSVSGFGGKNEFAEQNLKLKTNEWQHWKSRKGQIKEASANQKGRELPKGSIHSRTPSSTDAVTSRCVLSTDKDVPFNRRLLKPKNFQWVEKELQKVEREKIRLEQEMGKFLEKESRYLELGGSGQNTDRSLLRPVNSEKSFRLRQMKRRMGTALPAQEILVKTPSGFIRFKGISQKFTKRLYEWEKARGIGPEASTFALLEESAAAADSNGQTRTDFAISALKFRGSVPELSSLLLVQGMAHHTSSLSLNDVDDLKTQKKPNQLGSFSSERLKNGFTDDAEELIVIVESPSYETKVAVRTDASEHSDDLRPPLNGFFTARRNDNFENSRGDDDKDADQKLPSIFLAEEEAIRKSKLMVNQIYEDDVDLQQPLNLRNGSRRMRIKESDIPAEPMDVRKPKMQTNSSNTQAGHPGLLHQDDELKESDRAKFANDLPLIQTNQQTFLVHEESDKCDHADEYKKLLKAENEIEKRKINPTQTKGHNPRDNAEESERPGNAFLPGGGSATNDKASSMQNFSSVFVPTTRKIISPVRTQSGVLPAVFSYVIDDISSGVLSAVNSKNEAKLTRADEDIKSEDACTVQETEPWLGKTAKRSLGIPPLPNSPKFSKKQGMKETAPSIKTMIAKYNKKLAEGNDVRKHQFWSDNYDLATRRSPVFGRRTQIKSSTSRQNIDEISQVEIQKSASFESHRIMLLQPFQGCSTKGLTKSSSIGTIKSLSGMFEDVKETDRSLLFDGQPENRSKPNEDFLSGGLRTIDRNSQNEGNVTDAKEKNFVKALSVDAISSADNKPTPEIEKELQKSTSKFDIGNIKSKFKKMRMRRDKCDKQNNPAPLCRQSLLLGVPGTSNFRSSLTDTSSKSCPSSPVIGRSEKHRK